MTHTIKQAAERMIDFNNFGQHRLTVFILWVAIWTLVVNTACAIFVLANLLRHWE